jgi:parvulin-like peptidyl-prolyl isomerase
VTRLRSAPYACLALVVALALGAAACSSSASGGNALDVSGTTLSNRDFRDRLDAIAKSKTYVAKLTGADGSALKTEGVSAGTYSTDFSTQVLNQQISFSVAAQEVANRGITVGDDERAKAEKLLANDLTTAQATTQGGTAQDDGSGQQALDDLGAFKSALIDGVANILALQNDFSTQLSTDDALKAEYDKTADQFKNQVCISHILVLAGKGPTQDAAGKPVAPPESDYAAVKAKADDLVKQLAAGADFATLAKSSDDTQSGAKGGDLGCSAPGSFGVKAFDAAVASQPVGKAGGLVKTEYGYHIILVRSRGDLTFEEAKPTLQSGVTKRARTAFQAWLVDAAKKANVTVDPQWGSWDAKNGTVIPPEGATSTTTASPNDTSLSPDQLGQLGQVGGSSTTSSTP